MQVQIQNIRANPFRHIDRYPIREDKVAALIESIETTGFWDNLVGRAVDVQQGVAVRVEIAYGHHRREALLRAYPPNHKIEIVVREFSDEQMLQIMARENMEEWGSSAMVEHETISAVVEAYGDGLISLSPIELGRSGLRESQLRYAPSFVVGGGRRARDGRPYTAVTVAEFLGWGETKVKNALSALGLIEQDHLSRSDFAGLSTKQAEALVEETRRTVLAQQREREEATRRAAAMEAERQAAAERAAKAEAEQAAALERAKAAREQAERERAAARDRAERERIDRETQERERAAEQDWKRRQQEVEEAEQARIRAAKRAEAIRRENERAERERTAERERVSRATREHLRSGGGYKDARQAADKVRRQSTQPGPPPDLGRTVRTVASQLSHFFADSVTAQKLKLVLPFRKHFADSDRADLIAGLQDMRDQIDKHLATLGAGAPVEHVESSDVIDGEIVDAEVVGG